MTSKGCLVIQGFHLTRLGCAERPSQSILLLRAAARSKVGVLRGSATNIPAERWI